MSWITLPLLTLLTAFLCLVVSPISAQVPVVNPIEQSLSASELIDRGREFYKNRQFDYAVENWRQAVQAYKDKGDVLEQAMALNYLSLAYQQLENWSQADEAIKTSLSLLDTEPKIGDLNERVQIYAQALNTRGRLELALGQSEKALKTWEQATKTYEGVDDRIGITGSLINQAQAMEALGHYRRSCKTLLRALKVDNDCDLSNQDEFEKVLQTFEKQQDAQFKALGLRNLGNILRLVGDLDKSQRVLVKSFAVAQQLQSLDNESATLLSLGNTARALGNRKKDQQDNTIKQILVSKETSIACADRASRSIAFEFYQQAFECYHQAADISTGPLIIKLQAQLNHLSVLLETKEWLLNTEQMPILNDLQPQLQTLITNLPQIKSQLANLPESRAVVYAKINLAQSLERLKQNTDTGQPPSAKEIEQLLETAIQQAKRLEDQRAEAYALGTLGKFYEPTQLPKAQNLTQEALKLAQATQAWDLAYQWQWQLGRILKARNEIQGAIIAYEASVESLKSVRRDLSAINPDIQFSFRDEVDPVYRQLVELLLPSPGTEPNQANLQKAREVIASLQVAELENFLQCTLQNNKSVPLDQVADQYNAAIIYPIILPKRLTVIVKLPGSGKLLYYEASVPKLQVERKLNELRQKLEEPFFSQNDKLLSNEIYNWLLQPAETPLAQKNVTTLIFVLDGRLRNIPMAALYNGQQYLIEKYAIALNVGLELQNPQPFHEKRLEVLTAGITKEVRGREPLTFVGAELKGINQVVPSKELRDEEFISTDVQTQINLRPFSVVHLATHGQFSSQPEKTSIQAWDTDINVNQLSDIFRTQGQNRPDPIELLVLSACQTAKGDERAVLGLAGIAVQSGARSTIASLWSVDDESSPHLMDGFYRNLRDSRVPNKAEALRLAQKDLLTNPNYKKKYAAPRFWAPYILVGNWL